jgi:hypothetical protein
LRTESTGRRLAPPLIHTKSGIGPFFAAPAFPVFVGSPPACEGTPQARTPAPAASSAKRAVPRPRFLTRIAVIEHSMRAVSAPAAPAHHTCCVCPCCACRCRRCPQRSAFVASRPERCCEPEPRRAAPHRTRVSFTLFSLGKWSEASLDATTTSTGTVWWPRSSDMCILGADMTASPRAPRPAASPASGPNDKLRAKQLSDGSEAPRECQHTGRATQEATWR